MPDSAPLPDPDAAVRDAGDALARLIAIMARLRDPERGCPWDIEQDFDTIAPYTIEEAYEVADAIARRDLDALRDELGDLLLQVVYHARMAEEQGALRLRRRGARASPTRWSAATRTSSGRRAATRPPRSRPATGRRSRPPSGRAAGERARRRGGGAAGADPRGEAAGPRRPRRLRLARRRRGARQDRRGDRPSSSRPATPATPPAPSRSTAT